MERVEFIGMERMEELRFVPDAYRVRRDRKAVWLQRLCCWIMAKLDARHEVMEVRFVRIPIDGKTFLDRLFKQKLSLEFVYRHKPRQIIIGGEDYRELMESPEIHQMFRFDAETLIGTRHGRTLLGMEIVVVPWIRGIVVMP